MQYSVFAALMTKMPKARFQGKTKRGGGDLEHRNQNPYLREPNENQKMREENLQEVVQQRSRRGIAKKEVHLKSSRNYQIGTSELGE